MYKNNKFLFCAVVLFMVLCFKAGIAYSQPETKIAPQEKIMYSTSSFTNEPGSLSAIKPEEKKFSAHKQELISRLNNARLNNNLNEARLVEDQLAKIDGTSKVKLIESFEIRSQVSDASVNEGEFDYNTIMVSSGGVWAAATQTAAGNFPNPAISWVGVCRYVNGGADTCKFFYTTNGGQSWVYAFQFFFTYNMDFRAGELDLELLYSGTTVYLYGTAGILDIAAGNQRKTIVFRFNTSNNAFNGYMLQYPGYTTASNQYYNPRITSDNGYFSVSAYVYLSCSFDSTYQTNLHINKQKFAKITGPFDAVPTVTYDQPFNGGFFWTTSNVPAGSYLWTDIAFLKTPGGQYRILTTYNVPGSNNYNIYLAWSNDFGNTITGNSTITGTNVNYGTRVAFNAVNGNTSGMIVYTRLFGGIDWDPYCQYTTDGGSTWTGEYIDNSGYRSRSVDVIAPRSVSPMYKIGYAMDSSSSNYAFYIGGVPGAWNFPPRKVFSPGNADTSLAKVIAGYKNGGGDDCLGFYSLGLGVALYSSRLCLSTVGIQGNNNEIPSEYSLEQNYPNPFNPSTSIKFSLPVSSMVKLVVYDAAGKIVEELVNNELNAGNYEYSFNASQLASGVYFYKLSAGEFTEVKKMALIK